MCAHLNTLLPGRLESLGSRVVEPHSPLTHAWGDPAVVLRCGVARPAGYSPKSSETTVVNGVTWFQQIGKDTVTWTALRPARSGVPEVDVALTIPTHYAEQGAFLVDLATPLKAALQ